jgi:antitoxin MazE
MIVPVVQVGNSRGIRLPKNILQRLNFEDKVEITIQDDELVVKSVVKKARQGWNEAFSKMSENTEDKLLLSENIDDSTFEWVW